MLGSLRIYFLSIIMSFSVLKFSFGGNCEECSASSVKHYMEELAAVANKGSLKSLNDIIGKLEDDLKTHRECRSGWMLKRLLTNMDTVKKLLSTGVSSFSSQEFIEENIGDKSLIKVNFLPGKNLTYLMLNSSAIRSWTRKMEGELSPLHIICSLPEVTPATIEFVLENSPDDVHAKTLSNTTALMMAAEAGNLAAVKFLLDRGASVNDAAFISFDDEDRPKYLGYMNVFTGRRVFYSMNIVCTTLVAAVRSDNEELVTYLLKGVADIASTNSSWPLLFYPVIHERQDILRLLVEKGLDTNSEDPSGSTALHWAAERDETEVAALLISKGADINATDSFGWTSLHIASLFANKKMIQLLLDSGSDIEAKTHANFTVSNLAVAGSNLNLLTFLRDKVNSSNQTRIEPGCAEKYKRHTEALKLLIEHGANYNQQDSVLGWSPLHWAAASGNLEAAELLVSYGAVVSTRSRLGLNPYETAKYMGSKRVSEFLRTAKDFV